MSNGFVVPNSRLLPTVPRRPYELPATDYRATTYTQRRFTGSATPVTVAQPVTDGARTVFVLTNDGDEGVYVNLDTPPNVPTGKTGIYVPAKGSLVLQLPFEFDGKIDVVGDATWSVTVLEGIAR